MRVIIKFTLGCETKYGTLVKENVVLFQNKYEQFQIHGKIERKGTPRANLSVLITISSRFPLFKSIISIPRSQIPEILLFIARYSHHSYVCVYLDSRQIIIKPQNPQYLVEEFKAFCFFNLKGGVTGRERRNENFWLLPHSAVMATT